MSSRSPSSISQSFQTDPLPSAVRFLTFTETVEENGGPIWLAMTGPSGTRAFLDALVDSP